LDEGAPEWNSGQHFEHGETAKEIDGSFEDGGASHIIGAGKEAGHGITRRTRSMTTGVSGVGAFDHHLLRLCQLPALVVYYQQSFGRYQTRYLES